MNTPPTAKTELVTHELHGKRREDPYHWLRDEQWQEVMRDPSVLQQDIRDYLEAENSYLEEVMGGTKDLQETLFQEMKGRIKEDDSSVPEDDGPYAYYDRFREGGQYHIICRRPREGGEEQILLDGDKEAEGESYFSLGAAMHSNDHSKLLIAVDRKGSELYAVTVKDLETGELLADRIEGTNGNVAWAADSQSFFYTMLDENHRPYRVCHHKLGADPTSDRVVYEEKDPGFFVGVGLTESDRFLVIDAHDHTTSEVRLLDATKPEVEPLLVAPRERDVEYSVGDHGDKLLILTNADGAEDFKICEAPLDTPGRENWRDLVPHKAGRLIISFALFKDFLVRLERVNALPRIVITAFKADGSLGDSHEIAFEEEAYALGLHRGYEWDTSNLRFVYTSPTTPDETYDYDMASRERVLRKRREVPSGHNPDDYVTRRILAESHDGAEVPVTLLYHKDTPLDGSAPVLLYGYGSYGMSMPASFSTSILSLCDRGMVYAIAHIRGGMDKGYAWYRQGKMMQKKNTFLDFVAAAEGLIDRGWARPGELRSRAAALAAC